MGTIVVVPKVVPAEVDTTETHDCLLSDISDEADSCRLHGRLLTATLTEKEKARVERRGGAQAPRPRQCFPMAGKCSDHELDLRTRGAPTMMSHGREHSVLMLE